MWLSDSARLTDHRQPYKLWARLLFWSTINMIHSVLNEFYFSWFSEIVSFVHKPNVKLKIFPNGKDRTTKPIFDYIR